MTSLKLEIQELTRDSGGFSIAKLRRLESEKSVLTMYLSYVVPIQSESSTDRHLTPLSWCDSSSDSVSSFSFSFGGIYANLLESTVIM